MQEASGLGMLSLDEGFTALTALSTSSLCQAAVLPMNWARYAACRPEPHPLAAPMCTPTATSSLRATLESLPENDRIRHLDAFMKTLVPRFELDTAVTSLGVTSLGATALRRRYPKPLVEITSDISLRVRGCRASGTTSYRCYFLWWRYKGRYHLKQTSSERYGSHLYH